MTPGVDTASAEIGLLATDPQQLQALRAIIAHSRYRVVQSFLFSDAPPPPSSNSAPLWLLRLSADATPSEQDNRWQAWLENQRVTVIYDDFAGDDSSQSWPQHRNRCLEKLDCFYDQANPERSIYKRASHLWVLAASAGGPEAVGDFLGHINDNIRSIAFVYAQHIDQQMVPSLVRSLQRRSSWPVLYDPVPQSINEQHIYIPSVTHQVTFTESVKQIRRSQTLWQGDYAPSIDHIVAGAARCYGDATGVIVFSGMGDDGVKGCRLVNYHKGQVWAQSRESCTVDSMVQQVMANTYVSQTGRPEELAERINFLAAQPGRMK